MNKFLVTATVLALTSTLASAQYNTDCTRDYYGNFSCNTKPSDTGFIDFGGFQRGMDQANQQRQQQQMMQQQFEMQQRLLQQQQQMRLQQEKLNEINEERNTPEWQKGILVRREEGKRTDGKSTCVYQSQQGFIYIKSERYQNLGLPVAPEKQCPLNLSISKITAEIR